MKCEKTMKLERVVALGFAATILTIAACTAVIRHELRMVAYSVSSDSVVRQLEEEGLKTRELIKGAKRQDQEIAWPPLG
ncbi:hypothetical protein D3C81_2094730 [compost metagenome]